MRDFSEIELRDEFQPKAEMRTGRWPLANEGVRALAESQSTTLFRI
jgi:hypothetical protein